MAPAPGLGLGEAALALAIFLVEVDDKADPVEAEPRAAPGLIVTGLCEILMLRAKPAALENLGGHSAGVGGVRQKARASRS